jgi:hypothetical protein
MRRSIALLAPALLLVAASAQQQSPANSQRLRYLPYGLRGRVHRLLTKTQQLAADPRPASQPSAGSSQFRLSRLSAMGGSPTWLSFDENGRLVEQGTVSPDAKFASLTRSEGNTSVTTMKQPNRAIETIQRQATGSNGASSIDVYRDGKLSERMELTRNSGTDNSKTEFEQKIYDVEGKLLSQSSTENAIEQEGKRRTITSRQLRSGPNGQTEEHTRIDRFDADHQLIEHTEYDGNGTMICTLRFSGASLTYSVISSEMKRPCMTSLFPLQESKRYAFTLYPNGGTGELFTDIWSFADKQRLMEPDSIERLDASGAVIDKVSIRYERDAEGNWTTRTVSVLDPSSKEQVDIQRDTRTITYYDQQ